MWHEAVSQWPQTGHADAMLAGLIYLDRARIEDAMGRREVARAHYGQFLRRYDMPVRVHRHLVEEARAAVSRLSTGKPVRPAPGEDPEPRLP
jgi:hypothetical protein